MVLNTTFNNILIT